MDINNDIVCYIVEFVVFSYFQHLAHNYSKIIQVNLIM